MVCYPHQEVLAGNSAGERNSHGPLELYLDQQTPTRNASTAGTTYALAAGLSHALCTRLHHQSHASSDTNAYHSLAICTLESIDWPECRKTQRLRRTVEYDCALDPSLSYCIALASPTQGKLFDQKIRVLHY
jgi:hypothetical protein